MANLPESPIWESGITQIENGEPADGGVDGVANRAPKQLANRTKYLKDRLSDEEVATDKIWSSDKINSEIETLQGEITILSGGSASTTIVASSVETNTDNFNKNLSEDDDTLQKALDTLDNLIVDIDQSSVVNVVENTVNNIVEGSTTEEIILFNNQVEINDAFIIPISGLEKLYIINTNSKLTLPTVGVPLGSRVGFIALHEDGGIVNVNGGDAVDDITIEQYVFAVLIWVDGQWLITQQSNYEDIYYNSINYIFGGTDGTKLQDTDQYVEDVWTSMTDCPAPGRANHAAADIYQKGYLFAGFDVSVPIQDTDEYAPDVWTSKTDCPLPARYNLASVAILDRAYIFCGNDGTNKLKDTDEYNPDTWTNKTDSLDPGRHSLSAASMLDKGYLFCGSDGTHKLQDTDEYAFDVWTAKTDCPAPNRMGAAASAIIYKGYLFCGIGEVNFLQDTDEYSFDVWTSKSDCPSPVRYNLTSSPQNTKNYIFCGTDGTKLQDTDEYDLDTWTSKSDCPAPGRYDLATIGV